MNDSCQGLVARLLSCLGHHGIQNLIAFALDLFNFGASHIFFLLFFVELVFLCSLLLGLGVSAFNLSHVDAKLLVVGLQLAVVGATLIKFFAQLVSIVRIFRQVKLASCELIEHSLIKSFWVVSLVVISQLLLKLLIHGAFILAALCLHVLVFSFHLGSTALVLPRILLVFLIFEELTFVDELVFLNILLSVLLVLLVALALLELILALRVVNRLLYLSHHT